MAQGAFERMDNDMEDMSYEDQAGGNASSKIWNKIGIARSNKQGLYRLATVALGLLCLILLMVIISRQTHGSPAEATADGRFEPQTYDNLSLEIDQLQSSYSDLNRQMALLISSHNILIEEKALLLVRYHNLTDQKHLVETSLHQLLLQKAQLDDRYNKLDSENRQLQISYSNLNSSKSELQTRNSVLTGEIGQLQNRYSNLTRERDDLLKRNAKLDSKMAAGWIFKDSSLYKINSAKKSWHASRDSCLKMGADLVVVNNIDEQKFLLQYKRYWIGLSDTETEGVWTWVDGTELTTSFWRPGEPNNAGDEDCAEISIDASSPSQAWNDVPCSQAKLYICEDHV
ncbi:C-type lectin domain family 4 member M-like [Engraulis encrasicolus]|uniref:C-type lectin domain family 4 member M-like n=1 Tax=Engraulis encrasicolus TaxID=184585 RepID=UPI002FD36B4D